ncbi:MAG: CPBP family intramembrane metalloprotease [Chloroflexi bacterium]|nr:CPBP family intramembrane metalloprotease [Chloroflexota bacterium]
MTDPLTERRAVPWKLTDVAFAGLFVIVGSVVIIVLARLIGKSGDDSESVNPLVLFLLQGLFLLAVWIIAVRVRGATWRSLGMRASQGRGGILIVAPALLLMIAASATYGVFVQSAGIDFLIPPTLEEQGTMLGEGLYAPLNALVFVVWGPFTEELFFRGFLLTILAPIIGPFRAVLVSSALFAGVHVSVSTLIPIFLIGLVLGWLYLRTRSLLQPYLAHAAWNLLVTLVGVFVIEQ